MEICKNCGNPIEVRDPNNVTKGTIENYYVHTREKIKPFRNCLDEKNTTKRKISFLQDENNNVLIAKN